MSRRRRIRASDIASPNPRKGLLAMALIGVALVLILMFKGGFGDSTAGFMEHLSHDPDLELPQSATERVAKGKAASGASDGVKPIAPVSAAPVSAAPVSAAPVSAAAVSEAPSDAAPLSVAPLSAPPSVAPLSAPPSVAPDSAASAGAQPAPSGSTP